MDQFFDRLGDAIKNFLDDDDERLFRTRRRGDSFGDPDLDSAYQELDDFLNEGKTDKKRSSESARTGGAWSDPRQSGFGPRPTAGTPRRPVGPPESLRADFAELGVEFGAPEEACKAAYKKLLKIHHPDRHAGHAANMKKATEKSSRINAAYQRIEHWRETGKTD